MPTIVTPHFAAPTNSPPAFAGVRARPGQKFAVEWVKRRLREIHREAIAAGRPSPLNEPAAHLYLLLATYVLDRRFISESILVKEIPSIMHCDASTVKRARKLLTKGLGDVQQIDGGQGKADVRFAFIRMAGPLYVEQGGATAGDRSTSGTEPEVTWGAQPEVRSADAEQLGAQSPKFDEPRAQSPKYFAGSNDLEEADPDFSSDQSAQLDRFVEWWTVNYPVYMNGVLNRVRDADRNAASLLLEGRSLERVQAMSIKIWSLKRDRSRHDKNLSWVVDETDRSIRVLLEKASYIEMLVVGDEIRAAAEAERQGHIAEQLARRSAPPPEQPADQPEASEPPAAPAAAPERIDPAVGWAMVREALNRKCGVG